jgi:1-acyl-sn-glycerol-3-phosphate acyltransferase
VREWRAPLRENSILTGLLSWISTVPFLVAFGALLLVFDPLQRLARLFGRRPQEVAAGLLQASLMAALRICGTRFAVERAAGVRPRTGYLVIANHQSMFDIVILGGLLFSNFPKYVAKKELARWIPSISYNLREGGNALIDRGNRNQAMRAIAELGARAATRGVSAVIYPEGTRARGGELRAFKPAGTLALLAAAPELPVVPVAMDGSWKLLRHGFLPVPFGTRIRVHIGEPIPRAAGEDKEALLARAEREIRRALERWRTGSAGAADGSSEGPRVVARGLSPRSPGRS